MAIDPELLKTITELDEFSKERLLAYDRELRAAYNKHVRGNEFVDRQGFFDEVAKITSRFVIAYGVGLTAINRTAAIRSIAQNNRFIFRAFDSLAANKLAYASVRQTSEQAANEIAEKLLSRRFPGTNTPLSQRLTTVAQGATRVVRYIVNDGLKRGLSSLEIAELISVYVLPEDKKRVAPWTIARRELGKGISYIPRGVPAGSVEYNAYRIAVTETAYTYQQAPEKAHGGKWYVEGYYWMLSRSHPKKDICDEYHRHDEGIGKGVWKHIPKTPHPHCLCHTQVKLVPRDEMIEWLKKLDWDGSNETTD